MYCSVRDGWQQTALLGAWWIFQQTALLGAWWIFQQTALLGAWWIFQQTALLGAWWIFQQSCHEWGGRHAFCRSPAMTIMVGWITLGPSYRFPMVISHIPGRPGGGGGDKGLLNNDTIPRNEAYTVYRTRTSLVAHPVLL